MNTPQTTTCRGLGSQPDRHVCDLADAVLDAPLVALSAVQRATWGKCKACSIEHGMCCSPLPANFNVSGGMYVHPTRLAAAPLRVRILAG